MKTTLYVFAIFLLGGCTCGRIGLSGNSDAQQDTDVPTDDSADSEILDIPPEAPDDTDLEPEGGICWDNDEDGYYDVACGGDDCNDSDPTIFPGAPEDCFDGVDSDCGGTDGGLFLIGETLLLERFGFHTQLFWTGSEFGFFYGRHNREGGINFKRINPHGEQVVEDVRIRPCEYNYNAAWFDNTYGTIWVSWASTPVEGYNVYFQSLDVFGNVLEEAIQITGTGSVSHGGQGPPKIVAGGGGYILLWWYGSDVGNQLYITRLNNNGERLIEDIQVSHNPVYDHGGMNAAWTGSEIGIVWCRAGSSFFDVFFSRVSADGNFVSEKIMISDHAMRNKSPLITWMGDEFDVFWVEDDPEDGSSVLLTRLSPEGVRHDDDILLTHTVDVYRNPHVLWTGSEFGMLWSERIGDNRQLVFQRISLSEGPVGSPFIISTTGSPSGQGLVWTGSEYAVTWWEHDESLFFNYYYFSRIGFCE